MPLSPFAFLGLRALTGYAWQGDFELCLDSVDDLGGVDDAGLAADNCGRSHQPVVASLIPTLANSEPENVVELYRMPAMSNRPVCKVQR